MSGNHRSGRRPKPVELHVARGTYRRDRHGPLPADSMPGAASIDQLWVPDGFSTDAQVLFRLLESELGTTLRLSDSPSFALLCETWALLAKSTRAVRRKPTCAKARSAFIQYATLFDRLASKFGLDPSSREKLPLPSPAKIARSHRR
jgi:hypothetical protein